MEWRHGQLTVTDDPGRVDVDFVARMLRGSYWAAGRTRKEIERSLAGSTVFVLLDGERQVAFARAVTDGVTFAWIADVVVDPGERGRGLGKWLMECVLAHPRVAGASRQLLRTRDAHGLYERYGFERDDCMLRSRSDSTPRG